MGLRLPPRPVDLDGPRLWIDQDCDLRAVGEVSAHLHAQLDHGIAFRPDLKGCVWAQRAELLALLPGEFIPPIQAHPRCVGGVERAIREPEPSRRVEDDAGTRLTIPQPKLDDYLAANASALHPCGRHDELSLGGELELIPWVAL